MNTNTINRRGAETQKCIPPRLCAFAVKYNCICNSWEIKKLPSFPVIHFTNKKAPSFNGALYNH